MIKKIWNKLFNKAEEPQPGNYIVAQLNDKLMPIDRGEVYEDPLDEFLKQKWYGEISGGGTLLSKSNEIEYCDVEIKLREKDISRQAIAEIINKLEELGAPKGSKLIIEDTGEKIEFGKLEGLALYLDGVNLSDEVYKNSNPEALILDIKKLTNIESDIVRYWHGNTESGMYFYGESFNGMKDAIANLINSNPECENARVVQIA
ncbi:hypothetical protein [Mucilaginibacter sp.]|uniref:hypothetical protein n=1 Tax=Mucilaginibacter sp. TaxID=1882438 RepID=UPI002615ECC6|nr:hypothetical protein [Mucilaginibacter sp.]MDB4921177.1 hypothetical protein [Mucilaginibacter sp.]